MDGWSVTFSLHTSKQHLKGYCYFVIFKAGLVESYRLPFYQKKSTSPHPLTLRHLNWGVLGFYSEMTAKRTVRSMWVMMMGRERSHREKLSNDCLCCDRQLWSQVLGSVWKSEIADMSRHVEFSLQAGRPRCGWEGEEVCDSRGVERSSCCRGSSTLKGAGWSASGTW